MKRAKAIRNKFKVKYKKGAAIIETVAGICFLIPIFLLLVDVIALVVAQSINDDLAKQSARYASTVAPSYGSDGVTLDQTTMTTNAYNLASQYIAGTQYYSSNPGLVYDASIPSGTVNLNTTTSQVQVITQITCKLPVPVPFGGPSTQIFQAQGTWPLTGVQPTPVTSPSP